VEHHSPNCILPLLIYSTLLNLDEKIEGAASYLKSVAMPDLFLAYGLYLCKRGFSVYFLPDFRILTPERSFLVKKLNTLFS